MARIFIDSLSTGYEEVLPRAFEFLKPSVVIKASERVCIKPNLTFPYFRPGVMTNPEAIEAVVVYLKNFTDKITICESDTGGYNRFSMDEVFKRTGISDFAHRYGVRVVNVSNERPHPIKFRYRLKNFSVPLPSFLVEDTDLFITMPVPKVHSNTVVTLAIKNQWGIIQDQALRLKLHPYFQEVVYQVNKALSKSIAVVDGKYGLNRIGPTHPRGEVVELNWVLVGDDIFTVDYVLTHLMNFDSKKIAYLNHIFKKERISSLDGVEFNTDYTRFKKQAFTLERKWTDYPGLFCFHSRFLAYLGYESMMAKPMHWLLYRFREPFYDEKYVEKKEVGLE